MTSMSSGVSSFKDDDEAAVDFFFVPYSTGYALFLSTTILLSVFFAIFWGYHARSHDTWASRRLSSPCHQWTRHCCNAFLMFSFEASVALLTWSGSVYSTSYDRGTSTTGGSTGSSGTTEGPMIGLPGILVGTLLLWVPLAFLTDFLYIRVTSSTRTICILFGVFLITLLSVLPGLTMLTVYCKQMASIEEYTYYGPMIVTDVSVESLKMRGHFSQLRRRSSDQDHDAYIHIAKPVVHWGLDWGCPDADHGPDLPSTTWCSTSVYEPDCVRCEGRMKEQGFACLEMGTQDDAKQCVANKYGIKEQDFRGIVMDPTSTATTTIVSAWEHQARAPSSGKNESQRLFMHGNCEDCSAIGKKSYEYLIRHNRSLKRTGIGLEVLALCMFGGLFLWVVVSDQLEKSYGDFDESSVVEEAPPPPPHPEARECAEEQREGEEDASGVTDAGRDDSQPAETGE